MSGWPYLVCGGRDFANRDVVFRALDAVHRKRPFSVLIYGGARGADRLAAEWAEARGVPVECYPAEWDRHGKSAGPIRNRVMLNRLIEMGDGTVVAFPGGRGTADMVGAASKASVPVWEVLKRGLVLKGGTVRERLDRMRAPAEHSA